MALTSQQLDVVQHDIADTIFLEGPAGTGKTTAAVHRLRHLLDAGVPAESILLMVPQRTLALPYQEVLTDPDLPSGGMVTITTLGGLARQLVDLFWPLVAEDAGFGRPFERPQLLSLETAQYVMARTIGPVIDENYYFDTVRINRSRLYSQIIDNLNKAAVVGFSHETLAERLKSAWAGEETQRHIYDEAQECAQLFRQHCLEHNLLDFSLQVEVLLRHVWPLEEARRYVMDRYTHLIVENVEEDTPVTHRLIRGWLPACESALIIYDSGAGYRRFLGADADSAYTLKEHCATHITFDTSLVTTPDLRAFALAMSQSLNRPIIEPAEPVGNAPDAIVYDGNHRYHPEMVDWVADQIAYLVHERGVPPGQIAVLSPYLSDSLRFAVMNRLDFHDVPVQSHRPSRALREEPAARCLLTLAELAYRGWPAGPSLFDVAFTLMTAIEGLDLVRAKLLASIVYRVKDRTLTLFDIINTEMQQRLTFSLGERYERLRVWLEHFDDDGAELDYFFSKLFGEVLSQPGFGFHSDYDAARTAANLIDSARHFRQSVTGLPLDQPVSQEYIEMVRAGLIANQYIRSWQTASDEAVLLAPAYTFLMRNTPVDYQFWLNVGSGGWWERLYQPLTHPYVLSAGWESGHIWTDADEYEVRQDGLNRLVTGLIRRCRTQIYLGFSTLGEQGYEQRGPLLDAVQRMLRRLIQEEAADDDI